jgi:glutathione S-transferase
LIWAGASPYARKVMIVSHELGLSDQIKQIDGSGTPVAPNATTTSYNPLGKLPCLVPDDGPAIYDSRVICQYLAAQVPEQRLIPEGTARWAALTLEALGDGICDAAILIRYETVLRDEKMQDAAWLDGQWGKIDRALDAADDRWAAHLAGPFDLGHAALGCAPASRPRLPSHRADHGRDP